MYTIKYEEALQATLFILRVKCLAVLLSYPSIHVSITVNQVYEYIIAGNVTSAEN